MEIRWNNCFLCLNDLSGHSRNTTAKDGGQQNTTKINKSLSDNVSQNLKAQTKLLLNYLLTNKFNDHSGVISDIKQLVEGTENGGSGVNFCENCEGQLRKVAELHRELEVVQMKLVSVLKAAKMTVLQNSKKDGRGGKVGLEIFEQWLREQESNYAGEEGNEEEKTRLKEQRRILETLEAFQNAVIQNDKHSIDIPLVFLERCTAFRTQPSEQLLTLPEVTVKTEVPDLEDSLDTPMSDFNEELSNLSPETEASRPKRKYRKRVRATDVDVEIKREVLRPPRASTSTARFKMIEMSNQYKRKKKEAPSETDASRPPPRKYFPVPPSFQKKPHSKLRKGTSSRKPHLLYCCALCPFTIHSLYSLEEHLQNHENEAASPENPPPPQFQCDQCPSKFRVEQAFQFHMFGHTGQYAILCELCNTWQPPMTCKDHMKSHLEKTFACPNCSFCCTTRDKYIYHLFEYHRIPSILECDICGVRSSEKHQFLKHYYHVHQAIEKRVCGVDGCTKAFLNPAHLTAHKVSHTDKYRCSHCDKRFENGHVLKDHLAAVAGEKEPRWHCDPCRESFTSKYSLQRHKVEKHGVSKLQCDICGREFIEKAQLNTHQRLHFGRGFPCEHPGCDKVFETRNRLKVHLSMHSTERNFICDVCGAALKTKCHLKKHKLTHVGGEAKKFKCPECGMAFLFNHYLTRHLRVHKGDRPYICEACGKGFNQATTLYRHKQKCFLGPTPPVVQKRDERAKGIKLPTVDNLS